MLLFRNACLGDMSIKKNKEVIPIKLKIIVLSVG